MVSVPGKKLWGSAIARPASLSVRFIPEQLPLESDLLFSGGYDKWLTVYDGAAAYSLIENGCHAAGRTRQRLFRMCNSERVKSAF